MSFNYLGMSLDSPFFLAPLAGYTDASFRYLCREQGCALSFTEMISAKGLYYGSDKTEELLQISEREGPVGIQLFGSEPEMLRYAADLLKDRPNVLIDINMGCPVPKVVKNGEGSALIRTPELAAEVASAAVEAAGKPVTVKTRRGFSNEPGPTEIGPAAFAEKMEKSGVSAIAVHGRTREQFYSGKASWEAIKAVKRAVSIPVIGNGDVFSAEDALRMLDETGCDAVMIARGALGNPWIFRELKAAWEGRPVPARPEPEEILHTIKRHLELLIEAKGEHRAVNELRAHIGWYVKGLPGAVSVRRAVNEAHSAEDVFNCLKI